MAKATDILDMFQGWNQAIQRLNHSSSVEETRDLVLKSAEIGADLVLGNGTSLALDVQSSFFELSMTVDTAFVEVSIDSVNDSIRSYSNYINKAWWQFGGSAKRPATMTLPRIQTLGVHEYE